MEFREGVELFGRYRIGPVIGSGGFAIVYSAIDLHESNYVAIKILNISAQTSDVAKARFSAECKILASLSHPNIIKIFADEPVTGQHILVMEYCLSSISNEIAKLGKLSVSRATKVIVEMCKGLEILHAKGIVHRDIKPSNMLIGKDGAMKLADFGIAHIPIDIQSELKGETPQEFDVSLTIDGTQPGSLLYMAPEQVLGESVSPKTDIYSLGVSLYEMLTGKHYIEDIESLDVRQIAKTILTCEPKPPRDHDKEISWYIEDVVMKALQKNPDNRYDNVTHMREALEIYREGGYLFGEASTFKRKTIHWWPFWKKGSLRFSTKPNQVQRICVKRSRNSSVADKDLIESVEHIGFMTFPGILHPLIESGSQLPCQRSIVLSTRIDDQYSISFKLLRWQPSETRKHCILYTIPIIGIPRAPRGVPKIQLSVSVDTDGAVVVTARDRTTEKRTG